jgi:hypothetical protein
MAGVALVGYSGSLIKDAVEVVKPLLARALGNDSLIYSAEEPELSRVLVGKLSCMSNQNTTFKRLTPQGVFFILFAQVL